MLAKMSPSNAATCSVNCLKFRTVHLEGIVSDKMKHGLIHEIKHRPNRTASSPFIQKLKKKTQALIKKPRRLSTKKKKKKKQTKKGKKKKPKNPNRFSPIKIQTHSKLRFFTATPYTHKSA